MEATAARTAVEGLAGIDMSVADHAELAAAAQAVAGLVHRNIVTVHDYGQAQNNLLYMAMEFLDGPTLSKVIAKGPMAVGRACNIALQIARALRAAHNAGIVHRDLKPGNVILLNDDDGLVAALLAFVLVLVLLLVVIIYAALFDVVVADRLLDPDRPRSERIKRLSVRTFDKPLVIVGSTLYELIGRPTKLSPW